MNQPMPPDGEPTAAVPPVPPRQPPQAQQPVPGQQPVQAQVPVGAVPPGPGQPVPPAPDSGNRGLLIAILAVLGVIVVGGLVAVAFVVGRGSDEKVSTSSSTTTTAPESTTTSSTTATSAAPPATAATPSPAPVGDVLSQPAGQFCRDLRALGYSYSAAVDYWRAHGQPDRMDADKDGIPCETVYPQDNVVSYWGDVGVVPEFTYYPVFDLPGGLFCRDLADAGYDTYDALSYYLMWGLPPNMDADGNGIPCETVYSDAEFVWYNADFWLD